MRGKLVNRVKNKATTVYDNVINYDCFHLKNNIRLCNKLKNETIIVGSSYPLFGVCEENIKNSINLSLPSQDLYYSYKTIKSILETNNNLKRVILGMSYYSFNFDLSMSKNERIRIEKVYYNIFKDEHNYKDIDCKKCKKYKKSHIPIKSKEYFNRLITRQYTSGYYKNKCELTQDEMLNDAKVRALAHNKLIKFSDTINENKRIMESIINILNTNSIELFIVIFPVTSKYRRYFNYLYKDIFYENINYKDNSEEFILIDLFECEIFDDIIDFIDYDHLSKRGAKKVTKIINNRIEEKICTIVD